MNIPAIDHSVRLHLFHLTLLLTLVSGVITRLSAAPVITGVVNAASYKDPRLPGANIAPGSIFIVTGSGLGPANIAVAPAAFQSTSLSGTSVKVTVNGKTVDALMYYTSATQVAALMPSSTPTGGFGTNNPSAQVTITVTYNGEDSAPTPFQGVGSSSAGLFTVDSSGIGPAIVTYPDYSLVSAIAAVNCGGPNTACGSANAGDTLTLWLTGLGPVPGGDGPGSLGQSIPNLPPDGMAGGRAGAGRLSRPIRVLHRVGPNCLHGSEQRTRGLRRASGDSDRDHCQQQHRDSGGQRQPDLHAGRSHGCGREHTAVGIPSIAHAGDCPSRYFGNAYRAGEVHLRARLHPASGAAFPCVLPRPAAARHLHRKSVP
jgi:uncharacterized protein (TIGR03437 family)